MSVKRAELDVRQRGGTLAGKWTKLYCVLQRTGLSYWDSRAEFKAHPKDPKTTIALQHVSEVHCIKSSGQDGFMFEIKSSNGQVKTQHLCLSDDERQKWVYAVMKTKSEPSSMPEADSSEEEKPKSQKTKEKEKPAKHTKQKSNPKKEPDVETKSSKSDKSKKEVTKKKERDEPTSSKRGQKKEDSNTDPVSISKPPVPAEAETDYANSSGTMVVTATKKPTPKKDDREVNYVNSTGTMMITPSTLGAAQEDYANSTGTMVVTRKSAQPTESENMDDRAKYREEFNSFTVEQLEFWKTTKLEKKYKKECERILKKWKEETSAVYDALRKKEIEAVEQKYQQHQLDLERELQEKREKIDTTTTG